MAGDDRIVERRAMSADHEGRLAQLAQWIRDGDPTTSPEAADVLDAAAEYIAAQTSRIEELEGALRPFAAIAEEHDSEREELGDAPDAGDTYVSVFQKLELEHFRRARSILTKDQGNG